MRATNRLGICSGAHANHQFISDDANAHVPVNEKGKAAEHLLLRDVRTILKRLADAFSQTFVVRHSCDSCRPTSGRSAAAARDATKTRVALDRRAAYARGRQLQRL